MAKVIRKENEDIEALLKRFKKQVINEGIIEEVRKREYYVAPSLKQRLKSEAAQKRDRKLKNKMKKYIDSSLDY